MAILNFLHYSSFNLEDSTMGRKWNNIKEKKAAQDKTRSQNYSKVLRDIMIAAKRGGIEPEANFALKLALQKARTFNVPKDNVEKAIKKAAGEGAENWDEVFYEAYGADGVAIFIEATTNNPTRTSGNIKAALNRWQGSLGKEGCLQFVFERAAVFTLTDTGLDVDDLTMSLIDAGATDVEKEDDQIIVKGTVESFGELHKKIEELGLKIEESALERIPLNTKKPSKEAYKAIAKLIDILESDDDVQNVFHNMEWDDSFAEEN
jgi:YebC/PmpR family DNA-binding regulatory protein